MKTLLLWLLSLGLPVVARAAEPDLAPLRAAMADGRAAQIADQIAVPFLFEGRHEARDGVLKRVVPQLFTPAVRRCLQRAKARAEDGRYVLDCVPYAFYIDRDAQGRWRIAEFASDGE